MAERRVLPLAVAALATATLAAFARVGVGNGFSPAALLATGAVFGAAHATRVPSSWSLVFVASLFAQALAWGGDVYRAGVGFDAVVHLLTTGAATLAALALGMRETFPVLARRPGELAAVMLSIGLGIGACWEVLEWIVGVPGMSLGDTMRDLIADGLGALAVIPLALRSRRGARPG